MDFEIHKTVEFDKWITSFNDRVNKGRILSHISRMEKVILETQNLLEKVFQNCDYSSAQVFVFIMLSVIVE